ncbi:MULTISPECIES: hypothetical protein [unclassified Bacillus (in: firmicutes)]|uniref:hypothetical protein n=1 Tax=unclassified Bacillus (in: firmicutes) TaxID=185979 RepID=UPI0008E70F3E|nr:MULTISPECIES: hypothetical protein [unclassified Bacillus (in: firmicutes)]SFA69923.1 hypothetical protein SAMN02799634_10166 [Bacillus sp. UNCCL13]
MGTIVDFVPEEVDGATLVKVYESGWESDHEGIYRYGQQIQGWVDMLNCMKAYHLFGINLRSGKSLAKDKKNIPS